MKQTKILLTTIAMLLCSVMANAYDFEVDGIRYDITSFTELTVKASSLSETFVGDLVIPSKVQFNGKELDVTEVGNEFAVSNPSISSLMIEGGVKSIGKSAFKDCPNLTTINIAETADSIFIGEQSFMNCTNLRTINTAQTALLIGSETFRGCTALRTFNYAGNIMIGSYSFADCKSLELVSIEKLDSLSDGTFMNCIKLSECYLPNITIIGNNAYKNCQSITVYNIPNSVKIIGESAFEGCSSLTSMIIPNNVIKLGLNAFNYCTSLTSISIGAGLTYLPWIFQGCANLSDIRIEDATRKLTFGYVGYPEKYDPKVPASYDGMSYKVVTSMFKGFNLKNVYIGRNISTEKYCYYIERKVSYGNVYYTAYYYIAQPPFAESNMTSLTIGPLVTTLKMNPTGNAAFEYCTSLENVTIHSTATSIPDNTFRGCSKLTSLEIPNTIKQIGANAFANCTGLKNLSLGSSLVSIGDNALSGCDSLKEISIKSPNPPTYKTGFSSGHYINTTVNIPRGSLSTYQETEPWKNFWNLSESNDLFFEIDGIRYAQINDKNVEIVGNSISEPTDLYIKGQVEYFGHRYNVVAISHDSFKECSYLSSVQIGNGITSIKNSAFNNCINLKMIIIPQSVTTIGENALDGCKNLKELVVEDATQALCIHSEGTLDGRSNYIKVDGKNMGCIVDYYNSYFSNLPIEKLYIGRNLSQEPRYIINATYADRDYGCNYYDIISYDAPFSNLSNLKELIIGENVDILGPEQEYISEVGLYVTPGSFKKCSSIQTVEVKNPMPPTGAEFSDAVYSKAHLTVPTESKSLYKEAIGWKDFVSLMKYKITYVVDDSIYFADTLLVGDTIILPVTPIKEGYSFSGWSEIPETMPAEDIIVTGAFTINNYKLTYIVDGEIYTTDSVEYGAPIIVIEEPYKAGHTFNGWSKIPETMPANDITIVGAFKYAVTYMVNNEVYNTDSIVYGDNIVLIEEPIQEGYTFSGWSDIPETMPAEDITITGSFTPNTYTITYMVDEEIYAVDTIAYGDTIALIAEPTQEGYTFSGWSEVPEIMPAEDIIVTGSFVRNTYTITYVVDSVVYATDSITYGDTIALLDEPTQEGYTFSGWSDAPVTMPAEDIIIEGSFNVNYYALKYTVDDEPYAVDSVAYGAIIELREKPKRDDYEFIGWSEVPETMPAHDIEVYGNFIFTSVTDVQVDPEQSQKVIEDNQLFIILPDGKQYNAMGQEM